MKQKRKRLILARAIDLVRAGTSGSFNDTTSITASFIIALSGLVLYLDKVLVGADIAWLMPEKFNQGDLDTGYFIWLVGVTLSPLLIIAGSIMRPYFFSYIVPIYCYILQLYFILIDYSLVDNNYSYAYSIGLSIIFMALMGLAKNAGRRNTKILIQELKEKIQKAKLEHAAD